MKCKRCGECCKHCGDMFAGTDEGKLGVCPWLLYDRGKAVCGVQRFYGLHEKPQACKDYPFDNEKCFKEQSDDKRNPSANPER